MERNSYACQCANKPYQTILLWKDDFAHSCMIDISNPLLLLQLVDYSCRKGRFEAVKQIRQKYMQIINIKVTLGWLENSSIKRSWKPDLKGKRAKGQVSGAAVKFYVYKNIMYIIYVIRST